MVERAFSAMHGARTWQRLLPLAAGGGVTAALLLVLAAAAAQTPPGPPVLPLTIYGQALASGQNLAPVDQKVVALVNGTPCGAATTAVAQPGPNTPADDVGKTVYVVDVLADGNGGGGNKAGCGKPGDPVTLYFPESGRLAASHPIWQSGEVRRENVDASRQLGNQLRVPLVTADGVQ